MRVSNWTKSENNAPKCSCAIPIPVSLTANSTICSLAIVAVTRTSPSTVNFKAFEMKLRRIVGQLGVPRDDPLVRFRKLCLQQRKFRLLNGDLGFQFIEFAVHGR